ncbi:hypothetical protein NL676_012075 [Syzygium grande]|nr:hypothetical protein NL676_012075 [Syzygium grande]
MAEDDDAFTSSASSSPSPSKVGAIWRRETSHCCVSDRCAPPHFIPLHPRPASIRSVPAGFSTSGNHHSKSSGDDELFLSTPQQRLLLLVPAPSVIRCFPTSLLNLAVAADPAILLPSHREPSCDESPAAPRAITRSREHAFAAPLRPGETGKKKKSFKLQESKRWSNEPQYRHSAKNKEEEIPRWSSFGNRQKKEKTGQHRESYRSRNAALHRRNHQTEYHREAS